MAEVKWTPQAADDLEAVCLFISRDAPAIATVFAQRVFRATDRLADYPRLGRVVPELGLESVREILLAGYRIIYRIKDEQIHLLTIHHGARLLDLSKITT
jgi:addiction module RelE/StbE family toxin